MRALIAIATLLASSLLGLSGAAPASASQTCTPPTVHGVVVTALLAHGIGCPEAEALATHTSRHGTPRGWSCFTRTFPHAVGGGLYRLTYTTHCGQTADTTYAIHYHYPA